MTKDQVDAIPDLSFSSWTSQQLQKLDPLVFAAFTGSKMLALSNGACLGISAAALSNIPNDGLGNMKTDCWSNIPADSMKGLKNEQIPGIGIYAVKGFTSNQFGLLDVERCKYFTRDQSSFLNSGCSNMTLACLENFQLESIDQMDSGCFHNMNDDIFSKLSQDHINHIGCIGFSGVNSKKFRNALVNIGESLIDSINYQKLAIVPEYTVKDFVDTYWGGHANIQEQSSRSLCDQSELSWLKVIYSKGSSASCLTSRKIFSEPLRNASNLFSALRSGHASYVPNSFFQNAPLMTQFSSSFIGALSADQVSNIECGALYGFDMLDELNWQGPLQALSPYQLSAIFNDSNTYYSERYVVGNFSDSQSIFFYSKYCQDRDNCKSVSSNQYFNPLKRSFDRSFTDQEKNSLCLVNEDFKKFYEDTSSCSEHYESNTSDGFGPGKIAGVVIGTILVFAALGGFIYWYKKKYSLTSGATDGEKSRLIP
jgi:hypothetical protein